MQSSIDPELARHFRLNMHPTFIEQELGRLFKLKYGLYQDELTRTLWRQFRAEMLDRYGRFKV